MKERRWGILSGISAEKKLGGECRATPCADPNRAVRAKGKEKEGKGSDNHSILSPKQIVTPGCSQDSQPDLTSSPSLQDSPPKKNKLLILPEPETSLTTTSRYEPFRLHLANPRHLQYCDWHTAVVSKERGTWHMIETKFVLVRDCKYTPEDIKITPGLLTSNPERFVL